MILPLVIREIAIEKLPISKAKSVKEAVLTASKSRPSPARTLST